ncbi:MAG: hypothetical protein RIE53_09780 [Rhodothermales bacterium]
MDYSAILAILAILSMFWAMMRVLLTAFTTLNERRDTIATGHLDGHPITLEHRKTIFFHDWLPLSGAAIFFMLLVGFMIAKLPSLILSDSESILNNRLSTLTGLAAIMPFMLAVGYFCMTVVGTIFIGRVLSGKSPGSLLATRPGETGHTYPL